jgi:hypothetical protein
LVLAEWYYQWDRHLLVGCVASAGLSYNWLQLQVIAAEKDE